MNTAIEKTEALIHATRVLDAMYEDDPYRPRYHFTPPFGWMNDINGSIFWKGTLPYFLSAQSLKVVIGNGCSGDTRRVSIWCTGYITPLL